MSENTILTERLKELQEEKEKIEKVFMNSKGVDWVDILRLKEKHKRAIIEIKKTLRRIDKQQKEGN